MGDSAWPLQKYAGTGENYYFLIAVNFYPLKILSEFFGNIIWVCKHSDFEFKCKQKLFQYVKNIPKNSIELYFSEYFSHIEVFCFPSILISEFLQSQIICTKLFLQGKN